MVPHVCSLASSDSASEGFGFSRPVVLALTPPYKHVEEKEESDESSLVVALGVVKVLAVVAISVVGFGYGSCSEMSTSSAEA